jgi:hypothetical protein
VRRFARLRRRPEARRRVPPAPQCGLLAAFFRRVGAARPRSLPLSLPEVGATCGCISAKRVSLPQQLLPTDSDSLFSIHKMNWEEGIGNSKAVLMSTSTMDTDAAARCAFCGKRLPIVNGELRPWRASSGQFFCNEFCADDAEEVRFRRHGRADRKAHERDFFF